MTGNPSLYDRIGGEPMIRSLVVAFYVRVLGDPELAPFFRSSSLDKLHRMQHEFFSLALGGPVSYTGRPLAHAHHGRGITRGHFARFAGHMLETLEALGVSAADASEVIDRINSHANEITGTSY